MNGDGDGYGVRTKERKMGTGAGTGVETRGRTQDGNEDGSRDGNESSSGYGNGNEGGGEAKKRKKPHCVCLRVRVCFLYLSGGFLLCPSLSSIFLIFLRVQIRVHRLKDRRQSIVTDSRQYTVGYSVPWPCIALPCLLELL